MCGITGLYKYDGLNPEADSSLKRMVYSLIHRGPDETGIYIDNYSGIGQTRLSIIDPQGGSQPITNEDSTLWIVFNGEVFNYPFLREELLRKGHNFKTNCDTEVILHLFEDKREKCLDDLNGQFAFAIWDSVNEELFLARDRAGIAPLFYSQTPDGKFLFGSEIKAIFSEGSIPREINHNALNEIFTIWTNIPGNTFFKGVKELPPASYLKVKKGDISVKSYWNLTFRDTSPEMNYKLPDLVHELKDLLLDAVKIRLRADVPVGSYLSGGLDSSGITSMISRNFDNDLRTFGITFEEDNYTEKYYQQSVVSHLGLNHTEEYITNNDIAEFFPDALWNIEKPILRTAPVPLYLLSKRVRKEGYKVVLSGEGADEVFGGYNIFKEALIRKFWSDYPASATRHLLLQKLYPYIFKDKRLKNTITDFFRTGIEEPSNPFFSHQIRWKNTSKIKSFLNDDIQESLSSYDPVEQLSAFLPGDFRSFSVLGKAQYLEFILFLSGYLLSSQGDRMAMANSVELRIPFLDHRVIEFMSAIPYSLKIRGLNEKFLLKKVFEKDLPREIINRPKNPFRAPINYLFSGNSGRNMDYISDAALKESGLFDALKVKRLVNKINNGQGGETENMAAAAILSAQIIYNRFIKDFPVNRNSPMHINNYYDYRKKLEKTI
jgi:asparagine synthase (glutamine-hydrolysing)